LEPSPGSTVPLLEGAYKPSQPTVKKLPPSGTPPPKQTLPPPPPFTRGVGEGGGVRPGSRTFCFFS
jgi:hypothetical protein